jgi:hypothetical protein
MEAKHKLNWDYSAWQKKWSQSVVNNYDDFELQKNWNKTLITQINQCSAIIFKASMRGGANMLYMHPIVFEIIKMFDYIVKDDFGNYMLSGRYKITLDDNLPTNKLYVTHEGYPMTMVKYKSFGKLLENQMLDVTGTTVVMHSESPYLQSYKLKKDEELMLITPDMLVGEITILNHNKLVNDPDPNSWPENSENIPAGLPIDNKNKKEAIDEIINVMYPREEMQYISTGGTLSMLCERKTISSEALAPIIEKYQPKKKHSIIGQLISKFKRKQNE